MKPGDKRYDRIGVRTILAVHGAWLMVRRPRAVPKVMDRETWLALSETPVA